MFLLLNAWSKVNTSEASVANLLIEIIPHKQSIGKDIEALIAPEHWHVGIYRSRRTSYTLPPVATAATTPACLLSGKTHRLEICCSCNVQLYNVIASIPLGRTAGLAIHDLPPANAEVFKNGNIGIEPKKNLIGFTMETEGGPCLPTWKCLYPEWRYLFFPVHTFLATFVLECIPQIGPTVNAVFLCEETFWLRMPCDP